MSKKPEHRDKIKKNKTERSRASAEFRSLPEQSMDFAASTHSAIHSSAITHSEEETFRLAKAMSKRFKGKEVVLLSGELGAGKTIFAKGIAAGLGMKNWEEVCSPSFTIMNIYEARSPIYHYDLYRLEKSADILDLGWEDYIDRGVVIVEWGERIPFDLAAVRVNIRKGKGDKRTIEISVTQP